MILEHFRTDQCTAIVAQGQRRRSCGCYPRFGQVRSLTLTLAFPIAHSSLGALTFATLSQTALSPLKHTRESGSNSSLSAFVYNTVYGNITFAVTAVEDAGDLYFHLEAPADNSWVAVGTGSEMAGSVMWIVYRSGDEKGRLPPAAPPRS